MTLVGCGAQVRGRASIDSPAIGTTDIAGRAPIVSASSSSGLAPATPNVVLTSASAATVLGKTIEWDGIDEALVWPKLAKALPLSAGDRSPIVIQIGRDVPIQTLLRAVFTLRAHDLRVQALDDSGKLRVIELKAKRTHKPAGKTCRLAVFLEPDGSLRVAAPGGGRDILPPSPIATLVQALLEQEGTCPIRYVAFGAESNDVPFGALFDVMVAVDRAKAAGDARYVLGEAIRPPAPPSPAPPTPPSPAPR